MTIQLFVEGFRTTCPGVPRMCWLSLRQGPSPLRIPKKMPLTDVGPAGYPAIGSLSGDSLPNRAFLCAVLEGSIPGRVWAHYRAGMPEFGPVATESPFCFVAGTPAVELLDQALYLLRGRSGVRLVHEPVAFVYYWLVTRGMAVTRRRHFSGVDAPRQVKAPTGIRPEPIDKELYGRINWLTGDPGAGDRRRPARSRRDPGALRRRKPRLQHCRADAGTGACHRRLLPSGTFDASHEPERVDAGKWSSPLLCPGPRTRDLWTSPGPAQTRYVSSPATPAPPVA